MEPVHVGYIGVDHHHRDPYFQIAAEIPVTLAAVCEPNVEITRDDLDPLEDRPDEITAADASVSEIAEESTIYEDPITLIESESIDVVWITYSNDQTPEIAKTAIELDIAVVSEKPIARTAQDLREVAVLSRDREIPVTPTYFYRSNPIVRDLKDAIAAGRYGTIWAIDGRFIGSQLEYRDTDHYIYDESRSRGGVLQWIGLHWIDMMMYVLDSPISRVVSSMIPAETADVELGASMQFETVDRVIGTFQSGYYLDDRGKDTHLGIYGSDTQARSPIHHDAMASAPTTGLEEVSRRSDWAPAPRRITEYEFAYDRFSAWGDYVLDFFERFFSGFAENSVPADVHDALRVLQVLDAAYESVERGQWGEVDRH